jgi:hypothetical protein
MGEGETKGMTANQTLALENEPRIAISVLKFGLSARRRFGASGPNPLALRGDKIGGAGRN